MVLVVCILAFLDSHYNYIFIISCRTFLGISNFLKDPQGTPGFADSISELSWICISVSKRKRLPRNLLTMKVGAGGKKKLIRFKWQSLIILLSLSLLVLVIIAPCFCFYSKSYWLPMACSSIAEQLVLGLWLLLFFYKTLPSWDLAKGAYNFTTITNIWLPHKSYVVLQCFPLYFYCHLPLSIVCHLPLSII